MKTTVLATTIIGLLTSSAIGANWPQFRGPSGQCVSQEEGSPIQWSCEEACSYARAPCQEHERYLAENEQQFER